VRTPKGRQKHWKEAS